MLETVIALALLAFTAALVTTRASVALDQIATHAAFQDLQTFLLRTRADAFARETPRVLAAADLPLPRGWEARMAEPLAIGADGVCRGGGIELVRSGRVRARLAPAGGACRYARAS
jgi:type II secretory pathway pseudopilin PulG